MKNHKEHYFVVPLVNNQCPQCQYFEVDVALMFTIEAILNVDVASMFTIKAILYVDVASMLVNFAKHR